MSSRRSWVGTGRSAEGVERLLHLLVDGRDDFLAEMSTLLESEDFDWQYEEIDPDVFDEELERPIYRQAERIAVVGLSVRKCRPYY